MHSAFLGEFFGTMILILLGNGVVANVVLRQIKGRKIGVDRHHHRLVFWRDGRRVRCARARQ